MAKIPQEERLVVAKTGNKPNSLNLFSTSKITLL